VCVCSIVLIVVLTGDATGDMLLSFFNFDRFFGFFAKKTLGKDTQVKSTTVHILTRI
jgi:hypothetical protein